MRKRRAVPSFLIPLGGPDASGRLGAINSQNRAWGVALSITVALLAGCASGPRSTGDGSARSSGQPGAAQRSGGSIFERDGPEDHPPADLDKVPDAQPKIEAVRSGGPNKPYQVLGRQYTPLLNDSPFVERGLASWYGRKFHGRPTSSGEIYNMYSMTAAHPTLPIPSYVRVRNPANGRAVIVRVNDRGPFHRDRIIDLSYTAALKLDLLRGVQPVEVVRITEADIRAGSWRSGNSTALAAAQPDKASASSSALNGQPALQMRGDAANAPVSNAALTTTRENGGFMAAAGSNLNGNDSAKSVTSANASAVAVAASVPATSSDASTASNGSEPLDPANAASAVANLPAIDREAAPTGAVADAMPIASTTEDGPAFPHERPQTCRFASGPPRGCEDTWGGPAFPHEEPSRAFTRQARGFWVQLAAFSQPDGATDLQQRASRQLEWLAPLLATFHERSMYRLQAGPYRSRDEAHQAAARIRSALQITPLIVERR